MKLARYKIILALIDYILINFCFALAMKLKFMPNIDIINLNERLIIQEIPIFALISLYLIYTFEYNQLYKYQTFTNRKLHFVKLAKSIYINLLICIIVCSFIFKLGGIFKSRLFVLTFLNLAFILFFGCRVILFKFVFSMLQKNGFFKRKLIIYGAGERGIKIKEKVCKSSRWKFFGFIDDEKGRNKELNIRGNYNRLKSLSDKNLINTVIIAIDNITQSKLKNIIESIKLLDLQIFIVSDNYNILNKTQQLENFDGLELIEINYNSKNFYLSIIKRFIDFILSTIAILILSPLFLFLSILIKLNSKGPTIYKQKRIGINGKEFTFYKFRTMYVNNHNGNHVKFTKEFINGKTNGNNKIKEDDRVTSIGKFLRKTSLDELPQLLNVIKGEMSLVGPRPCLPYEYEEYKDWHKSRFMIKPGCTGVWQVSGRSEVNFEEMVVMDYYYTHNMSPWLDLKLMIKTIPVMLFGKGGF